MSTKNTNTAENNSTPASEASTKRVVKKVVVKKVVAAKKVVAKKEEPKAAAKKVVVKKAAAPAVTKKVVSKKPAASKEGGTRLLGKTSGLNVKATLAKLFHDNHTAKLTDEKLAKLLQKEFPTRASQSLYQAAAFTRLRREYNKGMFTHGEAPKRQSVAYEG